MGSYDLNQLRKNGIKENYFSKSWKSTCETIFSSAICCSLFSGVVYNYDEEGIHRDETGREQCISVPLVQPDMFELLQQWDKLLEEFSVGEAWLPHRQVV